MPENVYNSFCILILFCYIYFETIFVFRLHILFLLLLFILLYINKIYICLRHLSKYIIRVCLLFSFVWTAALFDNSH